MPEQPAGLGQPVRIQLKVKGPRLVGVSVDQSSPGTGHEFKNESNGVPVGSGRATIVSQQGGAATIEITPLQTGWIRLRIAALFADGGLAQQEYQINVVPSASGLNRFELNQGFKTLALVLEDRDEDREAYLVPEVQYDALRYPIYLESSEPLKLTVDQPEDDPVIQVDSNGLIHGLRPGTAVITADFDGIQDSIQVDVYTKEGAPAGYRRAED